MSLKAENDFVVQSARMALPRFGGQSCLLFGGRDGVLFSDRVVSVSTVTTQAQTNISANVTYHIKIAISDYGDDKWNSAIFIKAQTPCHEKRNQYENKNSYCHRFDSRIIYIADNAGTRHSLCVESGTNLDRQRIYRKRFVVGSNLSHGN
jgi:hypothetical protein